VVAWALLVFVLLSMVSLVAGTVGVLESGNIFGEVGRPTNYGPAYVTTLVAAVIGIVPVVASLMILRRARAGARPHTNGSLWLGMLIGSGAQFLIFGGLCVAPLAYGAL
jgi:hypothetical protein